MPTGNLRVALPPLAAGAFGYYANSDQTTALDALTLENIEALSYDENVMDEQVWYVHASSSTSWKCTYGGKSACPRP